LVGGEGNSPIPKKCVSLHRKFFVMLLPASHAISGAGLFFYNHEKVRSQNDNLITLKHHNHEKD
jgi:hypothetical protein